MTLPGSSDSYHGRSVAQGGVLRPLSGPPNPLEPKLTEAERKALWEATFAVPTAGFGPADPTMPILTARAKLTLNESD